MAGLRVHLALRHGGLGAQRGPVAGARRLRHQGMHGSGGPLAAAHGHGHHHWRALALAPPPSATTWGCGTAALQGWRGWLPARAMTHSTAATGSTDPTPGNTPGPGPSGKTDRATVHVGRDTAVASLPRVVQVHTTAQRYDLRSLRSEFPNGEFAKEYKAYLVDPEVSMQVLYLSLEPQGQDTCVGAFVFAHGATVCWSMSDAQIQSLLGTVRWYEVGPYTPTLVAAEADFLPIKWVKGATRLSEGILELDLSESDSALRGQMFAVSDGMAVSAKLAVWEAELNRNAQKMEWIPDALRHGKALRISREEVLRQFGELLSLRHRINFVMRDLADFYWDRPQLEKLYEATCKFFDVPYRKRLTNEKLTYCSDLAELLRITLSEKHSLRLEWGIVILISVEVAFECIHYAERFFA